jgi:hypothetical protein
MLDIFSELYYMNSLRITAGIVSLFVGVILMIGGAKSKGKEEQTLR